MNEPWVEEWIDNLKEGDKVIVNYGGRYDSATIETVDRITPSGLISVRGTLYKQTGMARGKHWSWLEEATEAGVERITQRDKIRKCLYMMHETEKLSYDQAVAIIGILKGE